MTTTTALVPAGPGPPPRRSPSRPARASPSASPCTPARYRLPAGQRGRERVRIQHSVARIPGRHHAGSASHWPDRGRLVTAPAISRDKIAAAGTPTRPSNTAPTPNGPAKSTQDRHPPPCPAELTAWQPLFDGSVPAENANLHQQNRRLAQQVPDLEDRLSELLGQQAFDRSGLSAPASTVAVHAELEAQRQTVLDLRRVLEERDEELAAARETNRRLMNQLSRSGA